MRQCLKELLVLHQQHLPGLVTLATSVRHHAISAITASTAAARSGDGRHTELAVDEGLAVGARVPSAGVRWVGDVG